MAAVVPLFAKKVPFSNAGPGAFIGEIWSMPAGSIADTYAITPKYINNILGVIGGGAADFPALTVGQTSVTLTARVALTQTEQVLILGFSAP